MNNEQFAWDSENECFYYINHVKKMYTKISKTEQKEVYEFLYYVYCVNWSIIKDYITSYIFVNTMKEISDY